MPVEIGTSIQPYTKQDISIRRHRTQPAWSAPTEVRLGAERRPPNWDWALLGSKRAAKHHLVGRRLVLVDRLSNLLRVDYLGWQHRMLAVVVLAESTAPVGS